MHWQTRQQSQLGVNRPLHVYGTAQAKAEQLASLRVVGRVQDACNMLTHIVGCNALQRSTKAVCSTLTGNFKHHFDDDDDE
jgi:hypothetical protein